MTVTAPPPTTDGPPTGLVLPGTDVVEADLLVNTDLPEEPGGPARPVPGAAVIATGCASAAAAWMVGGLFKGIDAYAIGFLGVLVGTGLMYLARRGGTYRIAEYLSLPLSALIGVLLLIPDTGGGSTVSSLVSDALSRGGFLTPPVTFYPGWRFLLVVLFSLVSAGAAGLAAGLSRPKLGVAVPSVLVLGAAVIEPKGKEITGPAVALVFLIIALTLAFGVELGGDGQMSAAFELPRLLRAGGIAAALVVGIIVVNSLGFLFPTPDSSHTIPPQKPHVPPPAADRVLFSYKAPRPIPLRLGVLDTYDVKQQAWFLPGFDPARVAHLHAPGPLPEPAPKTTKRAALPTVSVDVTTANQPGHTLPSIAGLERISQGKFAVDYDPATDALTLSDKPIVAGMHYSLVAASMDRISGAQLGAAGTPDRALAPYLMAPTAPNAVVALLASCADRAVRLKIPENPFDKLQCVRQALYTNVVAAGAGTPVDLPASRVAEMLNGGDASPYEIIAAEALLARWAGVPSRIGFGYYGGEKQPDGSTQVRPRNGAMWTEVYFNSYGWVPVIGVPPKARPSTSLQQKNQINAQADTRIQMTVYIPFRQPQVRLLFSYVRYYLLHLGPFALLAVGVAFGYPWLLKGLRTRKRRRWAKHRGPEARIAVAYAEFRDHARDLTVGDPASTPLRFLQWIEFDKEHRELAWLVTRAIWGDLRRDLREDDVKAAERMATSVSRRLDRAQPTLNRVMSRVARTSLKEPYSREVPNLWRERRHHRGVRPRLRLPSRAMLLRRGPATAMMLLVALTLGGCSGTAGADGARQLPATPAPATLAEYTFHREVGGEKVFAKAGSEALVSTGRLYSIHRGGATLGSLEVALFKPDVVVDDINDEGKSGYCTRHPSSCPGHQVFKGMQAGLGSGHLRRLYYGSQRAYTTDLTGQRLYIWYPKGQQTLVILDLLADAIDDDASLRLFQQLVDYENSIRPATPSAVDTSSPGSPAASAAREGDS